MSTDEEFANGRGCFKFVLTPAAVLAVLLVSVRRGRAPGPLPRGICPVCGNEYALRANRTMGAHKHRNEKGYRFGYCKGIGQSPRSERA